MLDSEDYQDILEIIYPLLGQKPWNASLGHGSFITFDFGRSIPQKPAKSPKANPSRDRGEWRIWIYSCAWRIEQHNTVLAGSNDSKEKMASAIKRLEGASLNSVEFTSPSLDTVFQFEEGLILRTFSIDFEECDHWLLFVPPNNVLVLGPGESWSFRSAGHPSPDDSDQD